MPSADDGNSKVTRTIAFPSSYRWYKEKIEKGKYALVVKDGNAVLKQDRDISRLILYHQASLIKDEQARKNRYEIVRRENDGLLLLNDVKFFSEARSNELSIVAFTSTGCAQRLIDDKNTARAAFEVMEEVSKTKLAATYSVAKAVISRIGNSVMVDAGQIGISEMYIASLMFPGDLLFYGSPVDLTHGDIALFGRSANGDSIDLKFGRITEVEPQPGLIKARIYGDSQVSSMEPLEVIARLLNVVKLGSDQWTNLANILSIKKVRVRAIIENLLREIESSTSTPPERQLVEELERRVDFLAQP